MPVPGDPVVAVGSIEWGGLRRSSSPPDSLDLAEADEVIVTGPAGWTLEYRRKGTGVVLHDEATQEARRLAAHQREVTTSAGRCSECWHPILRPLAHGSLSGKQFSMVGARSWARFTR